MRDGARRKTKWQRNEIFWLNDGNQWRQWHKHKKHKMDDNRWWRIAFRPLSEFGNEGETSGPSTIQSSIYKTQGVNVGNFESAARYNRHMLWMRSASMCVSSDLQSNRDTRLLQINERHQMIIFNSNFSLLFFFPRCQIAFILYKH